MIEKLFLCNCYNHGFTVNSNHNSVILTTWTVGQNGRKLKPLDRIKIAIKAIFYGKIQADEIELLAEDSDALGRALIEAARKTEDENGY